MNPFAAAEVDWFDLWEQDTTTEWLAEPLIVRGAAHLWVAGSGVGKSELGLYTSAGIATGRPIFDRPGGTAETVVYLDGEQSRANLRERLEDMGYGPSVLERLRYPLHADAPPLNTGTGARFLQEYIADVRPSLVVIDTVGAMTEGSENDDTTARDFSRFVTAPLINAGIATLRLDHSSHKADNPLKSGAIGSSAKRRDVDVEYFIERRENGLMLRCTKDRRGVFKPNLDMQRVDTPRLEYRAAATWTPGTAEAADLLDRHAIALDEGLNEAVRKLREAGEGRRRQVIADALKYRRIGGQK